MDPLDFDVLTTEELRQSAFEKARATHDVGFVWDVIKHLRATRGLSSGDGSSGALMGSIAEVIEIARELMGKDLGDDEPLLRAKFLDYLSSG